MDYTFSVLQVNFQGLFPVPLGSDHVIFLSKHMTPISCDELRRVFGEMRRVG